MRINIVAKCCSYLKTMSPTKSSGALHSSATLLFSCVLAWVAVLATLPQSIVFTSALDSNVNEPIFCPDNVLACTANPFTVRSAMSLLISTVSGWDCPMTSFCGVILNNGLDLNGCMLPPPCTGNNESHDDVGAPAIRSFIQLNMFASSRQVWCVC